MPCIELYAKRLERKATHIVFLHAAYYTINPQPGNKGAKSIYCFLGRDGDIPSLFGMGTWADVYGCSTLPPPCLGRSPPSLITKWSSFGNESVIPILYTVCRYEGSIVYSCGGRRRARHVPAGDEASVRRPPVRQRIGPAQVHVACDHAPSGRNRHGRRVDDDRPVVVDHHRHDRRIRYVRIHDAAAGDQRHHRLQHRHDGHGVDHRVRARRQDARTPRRASWRRALLLPEAGVAAQPRPRADGARIRLHGPILDEGGHGAGPHDAGRRRRGDSPSASSSRLCSRPSCSPPQRRRRSL